MAYICYKPKGSCNACEHYRWDEESHRLACFAKADIEYSNRTDFETKQVKES